MLVRKAFLLVISVVFSLSVFANGQAKKESVETLLEMTEVSKMVDTIYAQVDNMSATMATQMGLTEENRPAFDAYMKKVNALLREEMNWEKMKDPMVQVYVKHFSEQEIQGMIAFYKTEVGKSTIKKMPLVMQDSMGVSQNMMASIFPKIKVLADEFAAEVKASKAKPADNKQ